MDTDKHRWGLERTPAVDEGGGPTKKKLCFTTHSRVRRFAESVSICVYLCQSVVQNLLPNHSFEFESRMFEVQNESNAQSRYLEILNHLSEFLVADLFDGLRFHD